MTLKDVLDSTFKNLEENLSLEERAVNELFVYKLLNVMRDYDKMTPLRLEYTIRFTEYQRKKAVEEYTKLFKNKR